MWYTPTGGYSLWTPPYYGCGSNSSSNNGYCYPAISQPTPRPQGHHDVLMIGNSMHPTMKSHQIVDVDFLPPDKLKDEPPQPGEVVFLEYPQFPHLKLCKRVIFTGGQEGNTELKGKEIHVKVPEGQIWLEGDNKDDSWDSRHTGPFPVKSVIGKVRGIAPAPAVSINLN